MSEAEFLRELRENPDDDRLRFLYADWLDQQNTASASDKAAFIRLHCDLVSGIDCRSGTPLTLDERRDRILKCNELLTAHRQEWVLPLSKLGATDIHFYQGLPHEVTMSVADFLEHGNELVRRAPIRNLILIQVTPDKAQQFANAESLAGLRCLFVDIDDRHKAGDAFASAIASSPHLKRLTTLDLYGDLGWAGMRALAGSSDLVSLRHLYISADLIDQPQVFIRALIASKTEAELDVRSMPLPSLERINGARLDSYTEWAEYYSRPPHRKGHIKAP